MKRERGLMLDVGRKYFSVPWIEKQLDEMQVRGLNLLHLHLSDNQGFRLESERHPDVVSEEHYTKADIHWIVEGAAARGINVLPEIDVPGHMTYVINKRPEFGTGEQLDIHNLDVLTFADDLFEEFNSLFPYPHWHMGADEYSSPDIERFYQFIRDYNHRVQLSGKTLRIWNDGIKDLHAVPKDILIDYWTPRGLTPYQWIDSGQIGLINSRWDSTYYVLGGDKPNENTKNPNLFEGRVIVPSRFNYGSSLHVWCDHSDAESEVDIAESLKLHLTQIAAFTEPIWYN